jgi:hypothetical protein
MSESLGRAVLALETDATGLHRGLGKAEQQTNGWLGRISQSFKRLSSNSIGGALMQGIGLGAGLGAFQLLSNSIAGAVSYMSDAINDASDLAESISKVNVVFGEGSQEVQEWAEGAAQAFGQSKQQALEAAGTYGNLFQAFGIGQEKARQMSTTLVELAADLASFNNTSVEDALLALRSGLSGETEPLKRYGIAISDARMRTELLAQGVSNLGATLTPQQKSLAAYSLIMQDSSLAQGDFSRTSGELANQQRILEAQLADVSAEMGEALLPVAVQLVTFLNDTGIPVMRTFMGLLSGEEDSADGIPIVGELEDFLNAAADFGGKLNDTLWGRKHEILASAEEVGLSYEEMRDRIRATMDRLGIDHEEAVDKVVQGAKVLEQAKSWEEYQKQITAGGPAIDAAAADMADGIPQAMEDAEEAGKEVARRTPGSLANELRESIEDYDKAIDELAEVAEKSVSDLSERQKIEGILASQELTDALNSDSTRTKLLALELVNDLVSDYELLAPGALGAGQLVNPALQNGILSNLGLAEDAGEAVVDAAGNPLVNLPSEFYTSGAEAIRNLVLGINDNAWKAQSAMYGVGQAMKTAMPFSEPKDPRSPLRGITKWGRNIVRSITDDIHAHLGLGRDAALALAGSLVPTFNPKLAFASSGIQPQPLDAGNRSGTTYQLIVNGVEKRVRTREEALRELEALGAFSDGRLE